MARQSDQPGAATPPATRDHSDTATAGITPDMEDVRVVYQIAVTVWTYEGTLVWSRFNAMLVVHGILIAVIGQFVLNATNSARMVLSVLSGVGLVAAFLWLANTVRGFAYHDAYRDAAREQERNLSAHFLTKLERPSGRFSRFRSRSMACCTIGIFALLYLGLLIYVSLYWLGAVP